MKTPETILKELNANSKEKRIKKYVRKMEDTKAKLITKLNDFKKANCFNGVVQGEIFLEHEFNSIEEFDKIMESKDWDGIVKHKFTFEIGVIRVSILMK